jgi:hypothetical protein
MFPFIGPSQARARMKEDREKSVMQDLDAGKRFAEEKKAKVKAINPQSAPHHHTPLKDNVKFKNASAKLAGGVSNVTSYIEPRLSPNVKVVSRAKKGIYNINRGFQL